MHIAQSLLVLIIYHYIIAQHVTSVNNAHAYQR